IGSASASSWTDRPPVPRISTIARRFGSPSASNGSPPTASDGTHLVVLRVVRDLGQPERLHERRHIDAEPTAETLLQPVPATDRVVVRPRPRLDRTGRSGLLLVGAAERHPVAVRLEHRVEVLDGALVVLQLGAADLADDHRRIVRVVEVHRVLTRPGRRREPPGIVLRAGT